MRDDARFVTKGDFGKFREEVAERDGRLATELAGIHGSIRSLVKHLDEHNITSTRPVVPPMRPPMPSLQDIDLDPDERTLNGTPIFHVTGPKLQEIRERGAAHAVASARAQWEQWQRDQATESDALAYRAMKARGRTTAWTVFVSAIGGLFTIITAYVLLKLRLKGNP